MNKKGFTLIELLAVIVILAIIALIAVPIVLNIIDESKSNAGLRGADFYLNAVEYTISDAYLNHGGLTDGEYPITPEGNLCKTALPCSEENTLKVEVNGETPTSGKIAINSGNISSIELNYKDGKTIVKNSDGDLVYQEITEPIKLCIANTTKATALVWQGNADPALETSYATGEVGLIASTDGAYTPGVAYTCNFIDDNETNNMTFFVLSSTEETVTLISGANFGETVAWSLDGENHKDDPEEEQAVTAKAALAERTTNWSNANGGKLSEEQMSTIKLPTAYQIAEAVGQTFSGSDISELPSWLKSYTKTPVAYGYWTSTPNAGDSDYAWYVYYDGIVSGSDVVNDYGYGVRPVITISKSNV